MTDAAPDIASIVARGAADLERAGFTTDDARIDAGVLARHLLGWDRAAWLLHRRDPAPRDFPLRFSTAIARRAAAEPVAYIIGVREFYGRDFRVSPAVLIPRPETELIVDAALAQLRQRPAAPAPLVYDVGTGSGCIAVTLALEAPHARLVATDISTGALDVAAGNAATHGVAQRIAFRHGAFFAEETTAADLIVSNPPYVAESDRGSLDRDVVAFEPETALFAGADGLACIRELVARAPAMLVRGGRLIFEFGFGQAAAVDDLLRSAPGLDLIETMPDLQGIPRVAVAARITA